ncbi:phenylalanine--tRNA ligase subunit alpha [Puniceicoccales bacterium CK1056]|uniref:Phenylalanine--tRNA ligase alpha subunit n=1 Tax=Oceanipulchritudo coccoides TaxID=2706888 RepID=A0A6B2M1C1_9BACT|nr:phenylalanine--tRNA ligase subunit alpha [Oceanipulchritudo coccoides]NDV61530.1 phenylalanine--tRNA ligase subunit alpha [Oceanipulchritudo coccoides]
MEEELKTIIAAVEKEIGAVVSAADFEQFKAKISGPKGQFTALSKQIAKLPVEERPLAGKLINVYKQKLQAIWDSTTQRLEQEALSQRLGPPVDATLPSPELPQGTRHLLTQVREEIVSILRKIGFVVADGPEVETEYYCFDALNTPPDHPARDLQDTYYVKKQTPFGNISQQSDERYLLRTHTSSVQIRTMLEEKPPIRIIAPGRCFRRDTADATHSANFHQIEALYVDRGVTIRDLKADLDYLFRSLLGPDAETRFRPHYFSYTEPSFEVDLKARHLGKVGSEWMEIMGCGMVDPAVFEEVGYDPKEWTGYAFGLGIERIAMTLYGIDDIRYLYQNDVRLLSQFK